VSNRRTHDASPDEVEAFLAESPVALAAFSRVQEVLAPLGPTLLRLSATQVTWARRRGFAFLWLPTRWLGSRAAPAVLSIAATRPIASARWKEVVEVRPTLWMHHLELAAAVDIDTEAAAWLAEAYTEAG
jgi:hypothetical protein